MTPCDFETLRLCDSRGSQQTRTYLLAPNDVNLSPGDRPMFSLGFENVTTDAYGLASFDTNFVHDVTTGTISATATSEATNDSSEHCRGVTLRRE
jgi:hypothetical protein